MSEWLWFEQVPHQPELSDAEASPSHGEEEFDQ